MIILFIAGLLLGGLAVVFTLQNIEAITVTFFSWHLTGSLALILSLAIGTGMLVAILLILPESIKNYFKYRSLKNEYEKLAEELRKERELRTFTKKVPPTQDEIARIAHGEVSDVPLE